METILNSRKVKLCLLIGLLICAVAIFDYRYVYQSIQNLSSNDELFIIFKSFTINTSSKLKKHATNMSKVHQYHQDINHNTIDNSCACHRKDVKIFNLGFPKCGTVTLHVSIDQMGCNSIHQLSSDIRQINLTKLSMLDPSEQTFTGLPNAYTRPKFHIAKLIVQASRNHKSLLHYFADDVNAFTRIN